MLSRWWIAGGLAVVALAGAWYVISGARQRATTGIPGPLGGPEIALDVNTMIGRRGPAFALPDGDGRIHPVAPGETGRPLVVISHMGYF